MTSVGFNHPVTRYDRITAEHVVFLNTQTLPIGCDIAQWSCERKTLIFFTALSQGLMEYSICNLKGYIITSNINDNNRLDYYIQIDSILNIYNYFKFLSLICKSFSFNGSNICFKQPYICFYAKAVFSCQEMTSTHLVRLDLKSGVTHAHK